MTNGITIIPSHRSDLFNHFIDNLHVDGYACMTIGHNFQEVLDLQERRICQAVSISGCYVQVYISTEECLLPVLRRVREKLNI